MVEMEFGIPNRAIVEERYEKNTDQKRAIIFNKITRFRGVRTNLSFFFPFSPATLALSGFLLFTTFSMLSDSLSDRKKNPGKTQSSQTRNVTFTPSLRDAHAHSSMHHLYRSLNAISSRLITYNFRNIWHWSTMETLPSTVFLPLHQIVKQRESEMHMHCGLAENFEPRQRVLRRIGLGKGVSIKTRQNEGRYGNEKKIKRGGGRARGIEKFRQNTLVVGNNYIMTR